MPSRPAESLPPQTARRSLGPRGAHPGRAQRRNADAYPEGGRELIRRRGYARFRTAEVAEEAGLSRGAQLHHFPTKDSLVVATLEYVFEQAQALSRRRASAVNRPRDLIEAVIEDAREFFFSEHFMVAIDIVLSTSTDQSVRSRSSIFRERRGVRWRPPGRGRWPRAVCPPACVRHRRFDPQSCPRDGAANIVGQRSEMVR